VKDTCASPAGCLLDKDAAGDLKTGKETLAQMAAPVGDRTTNIIKQNQDELKP